MTPKEKALELYNKFRNEIPVMSANVRGKRIALIAVDEIIGEISTNRKLDWINERRDGEEFIVYWKEVKSEIEKL